MADDIKSFGLKNDRQRHKALFVYGRKFDFFIQQNPFHMTIYLKRQDALQEIIKKLKDYPEEDVTLIRCGDMKELDICSGEVIGKGEADPWIILDDGSLLFRYW